MSSSVPLPSPNNDYAAPIDARLNTEFWDAALKSVGARIRALEAVKADWEALVTQGTGQALAVIQANVEPQLASLTAIIDQLKADVAAAEDAIATIVAGGISMANVAGLGSALALKANITYVDSATASLLTAIASKADKTIQIKAGGGLSLDGIAGSETAPATGDLTEARTLRLTVLPETKASLHNRLLNGWMQVCQDRALGATVDISSDAYALDGVKIEASGGGVLRCTQISAVGPKGSRWRLRAAVVTADAALAATDRYAIVLPIEGVDVADLRLGLASGVPFVIQVTAKFPAAGVASLQFGNAGSSRSYVHEVTISAAEANTDKQIKVAIPADVVGTWLYDASGVGLYCRITLAAGSTYSTSATDVWQGGHYLAGPNQTNWLAAAGAVFEIAEVALQPGTEFPELEMQRYPNDLVRCRRYFRTGYLTGWGYASAAVGGFRGHIERYGTPMRVTPAISFSISTYSNCSAIALDANSVDGFTTTVTASSISNYAFSGTFTSNARLT